MEIDGMCIDNDHDGELSEGDKVAEAFALSPYLINELNGICINPTTISNIHVYIAGVQTVELYDDHSVFRASRDLPITQPNCWTVQVVSGFEGQCWDEEEEEMNPIGGLHDGYENLIMMFTETIEEFVSQSNTPSPFNPNPNNIQVTKSQMRQISMLHEVGHAFGLSDLNTCNIFTPNTDDGVMSNRVPCWYLAFGNNRKFTSADQKTIQQQENLSYAGE